MSFSKLSRPVPRWAIAVWVLLIAAVWLVGAWGFVEWDRVQPGEKGGLSDALYRSLLLFFLQGPALLKATWQLEIARWLAPFLAAVGVLKALFALFASFGSAPQVISFRDDQTNHRLRKCLEVLVTRKGRPIDCGPLECFLHATDRPTLGAHQLESLRENSCRYDLSCGPRNRPVIEFEYFGRDETLAREMLNLPGASFHASFDERATADHLLLIGWNATQKAVLVEAVRRWRYGPKKVDKPLRVTIVARGSMKQTDVDALAKEFPVCRFVHFEMDDAHSGWETAMTNQSVVYIAAGSDAESIEAANRLPALAGFGAVLIRETDRAEDLLTGGGGRLRVFYTGQYLARPELLRGITERIARACHEQYLRDEIRAGHAMGSRRALYRWQELRPLFKRSNLRQAATMAHCLQNGLTAGHQIALSEDANISEFDP